MVYGTCTLREGRRGCVGIGRIINVPVPENTGWFLTAVYFLCAFRYSLGVMLQSFLNRAVSPIPWDVEPARSDCCI